MKFLSLFAGIGGIDLGLTRAGHECIAQVEIDPWCRSVLEKHWAVSRFEDVEKFCLPETEDGIICPRCGCIGTDRFTDECGFPDLISAGFECQDISIANWNGPKGIDGARSGLWREVVRIIGQLEPRYVLLENSPEIVRRGLGTVLGDLAGLGYSAEWACLSARRFGAPHNRRRWYAVAYAPEIGPQTLLHDGIRQHVREEPRDWELAGVAFQTRGFWATEPAPEPVADGLSPGLVARELKACGNAAVPQISEFIGRLLR